MQYTDVSEMTLYVLDSTSLRFGEIYKNAPFSKKNRAFRYLFNFWLVDVRTQNNYYLSGNT